jgi:hypothetical protein
MTPLAARFNLFRHGAPLVALIALLVTATTSSAASPRLSVSILAPTDNATVSNSITWQVSVSNGTPDRVTFAIDGVVGWTATSSPWTYGGSGGVLDTTKLSDGTHQLVATAYPSKGPPAKSSVVVTVANSRAVAPPASTAPPVISGTAVNGQTLSTSSGSWSGATPMTYGYQWQRCDSAGSSCSDVVGATATTYSLGSTDVGATLRVAVSATNTAGSATSQSATTAVVSDPTSAPSACVSGECLPVGDLPGWRQVFVDDFGSSVPLGGFSGCVASSRQCSGLPADVRAKWFAYPDGWKDSYVGTYMPSRVMSVQGGLMNLYLHSENGSRLVAAPEPIVAGAVGREGGLLYGRYAIRFRADQLAGYKTSWMLWPDSEVWPRDGEIDFPEGDLAGTQWSTMYGFVHHQGATSSSDQDWFNSGVAYGDWHTAVIEWLPGRVSFSLDGRLVGTTTTAVPDTPMHLVLQTPTTDSFLAALGTAGNVQIDWIAIWTPA